MWETPNLLNRTDRKVTVISCGRSSTQHTWWCWDLMMLSIQTLKEDFQQTHRVHREQDWMHLWRCDPIGSDYSDTELWGWVQYREQMLQHASTAWNGIDMSSWRKRSSQIRRPDNVEIRRGKLKQWRDAWDLYYAQGMLDYCWSHLESGMDPTSISSASEEDWTQTMQKILRQDKVSLGTLHILKMHQQCIEGLHRRQ